MNWWTAACEPVGLAACPVHTWSMYRQGMQAPRGARAPVAGGVVIPGHAVGPWHEGRQDQEDDGTWLSKSPWRFGGGLAVPTAPHPSAHHQSGSQRNEQRLGPRENIRADATAPCAVRGDATRARRNGRCPTRMMDSHAPSTAAHFPRPVTRPPPISIAFKAPAGLKLRLVSGQRSAAPQTRRARRCRRPSHPSIHPSQKQAGEQRVALGKGGATRFA